MKRLFKDFFIFSLQCTNIAPRNQGVEFMLDNFHNYNNVQMEFVLCDQCGAKSKVEGSSLLMCIKSSG